MIPYMDASRWHHPKLPPDNQQFQWDKPGAGIWQVKVVVTAPNPPPVLPPPQAPPAAGKSRNQYDLATVCPFGDFDLKLEFRCPDVRSIWNCNRLGSSPTERVLPGPAAKPCDSPIYGISNWGNSGVKAMGKVGLYEVQILDSYNAIGPPPGDPTVAAAPMNLGGDCWINPNEICGAVYRATAPSSNRIKVAINAAVGYPPIPNGDWNSMEIQFMSARFTNDANKTKVRCATVTVILNGTLVQNRVGIAAVTSKGEQENAQTGPDHRYTNENWVQGMGVILLQEHDSRVQFQNVQVNAGWQPTAGGMFDPMWQRTPSGTTCV